MCKDEPALKLAEIVPTNLISYMIIPNTFEDTWHYKNLYPTFQSCIQKCENMPVKHIY